MIDNRKEVFTVTIKDYNLVPELNTIDTIITSLDTFRDEAAFTLHSILTKDLTHNFLTTSIDS